MNLALRVLNFLDLQDSISECRRKKTDLCASKKGSLLFFMVMSDAFIRNVFDVFDVFFVCLRKFASRDGKSDQAMVKHLENLKGSDARKYFQSVAWQAGTVESADDWFFPTMDGMMAKCDGRDGH